MDIFKNEYVNAKGNILKYLYENRYLKEAFYMQLNPYVDFDMVVKHRDKILYIYLFSCNRTLINDERFLDIFTDDLHWNFVSQYLVLTPERIEKYNFYLDWKTIWANPTIIPYLEHYKQKGIHFPCLSVNIGLTEQLIDSYRNQLNWRYLSQKFPFTVEMIEKYKDYINWFCLNHNFNIDEKIIVAYRNRFDLKKINTLQLSLNFIEENFELLHVNVISRIPILSREFIENHIDSLNIYDLSQNPSFTLDLIEKYIMNVPWYEVSKNPNLTLEFINKYRYRLNEASLGYNKFLYNDQVFEREIKVDIEKRRKPVLESLHLVDDVKKYILKFYIGYN